MMEPSSSRSVIPSSSRGVGQNQRPQTAQTSNNNKRKPPPVSMTCNRCGKPLTTTLFRVECDCLFCEDCTYSHFEKHSNCPCCRKTLGEDGFMELVIADPSNATQPVETLKNSFQFLFTKSSNQAQLLSKQQVCLRLMRQLDEMRSTTRFVLKQFVYDATNQGNRSSDMVRQYRKIQNEHTQLKQSSNSFRIQAERTIADQHKKLHASAASSKEKDNLISELKNQNAQLKEIIAADGIPSSSHSQSSGGGGRRGPGGHHGSNSSAHSGGSGGGRHHHSHSHSHHQAARPPLRDIIVQQQGGSRSRSAGSGGGGGGSYRPVTGGTESVIAPTPILAPPMSQNNHHHHHHNRPSSTGSVASVFGDTTGGGHHTTSGSSSTFRDYSSGFVFSRHGGSGGKASIHQQQSKKPRLGGGGSGSGGGYQRHYNRGSGSYGRR